MEAHAIDEWEIQEENRIIQPTIMNQRLEAVKKYLLKKKDYLDKNSDIEIYLDLLPNSENEKQLFIEKYSREWNFYWNKNSSENSDISLSTPISAHNMEKFYSYLYQSSKNLYFNQYQEIYNVWPLRVHLFNSERKIQFISEPTELGNFNPHPLLEAIQREIQRK